MVGRKKYLSSSSCIIAHTRPSLRGAAGIAAEGGTLALAVGAGIAVAVASVAAAVARKDTIGRTSPAVWASAVHQRTGA
jgi:hypothetical protein